MTERKPSRRAAFERVGSFLGFGKVEKPNWVNLRKGQERSRARRQYDRALQSQQLRRRVFLVTGGSVGAAVGVGAAFGPRVWDIFSKKDEPEPFSGEVEETRQYLAKWEAEVARNPNAVETYFPKIRDLAIAYFTNRMNSYIERDMNPRMRDIKNKILFLPEGEYVKKIDRFCVEREFVPGANTPAFHSVAESTIFLNKDYYLKNKSVTLVFVDMTHELHHAAPLRKTYTPPIRVLGMPEEVIAEEGLTAIVTYEKGDCSTVAGRRIEIEEIVVHDSTMRMVGELGLQIPAGPYDRNVSRYRTMVLAPLFGGDFRELLGYHQATEPDKFFQSIGQRIQPGTSLEEQLFAGTEHILRFIQS